MKLLVMCDEPGNNPEVSRLIDQMLTPLDESDVQIKTYYPKDLNRENLPAGDLVLADKKSIETILNQEVTKND